MGVATKLLCQIPYADTQREAERRREQFVWWCEYRDYHKIVACGKDDWEQMVTFYRFPKKHWPHLRTTNPVESRFAAARLRTDTANWFKKVQNATAVIWKMLCVAKPGFRYLKHQALLQEVARGVTYVDGVQKKSDESAA